MNLFNVDIKKLAVEQLPTFLRKELVLLVIAMMSGVEYIYNYFTIHRTRNLVLLQHNTSKASVEALMRKTFGDGIFITQGVVQPALYLSTNLPEYLSSVSPRYLHTEGLYLPKETIYLSTVNPIYIGVAYLESYIAQVDYTIHVPAPLWGVYHKDIEGYANLFSLPGMTFNYNIY